MLAALWMYLSKMKHRFEYAQGCEFRIMEDALVWNWEDGSAFVFYIKDGDYVLDVYTSENEPIMQDVRCYDYFEVVNTLEDACKCLNEEY